MSSSSFSLVVCVISIHPQDLVKIGMDPRTAVDRRSHMDRILKEADLQYIVQNGIIIKSKSDEEEQCKRLGIDVMTMKKNTLASGTKGCLLAQISAWIFCYEQFPNANLFLLLEDDVNTNPLIKNYKEQVDWMAYSQAEYNYVHRQNPGNNFGNQAQIITRAGLAKLIACKDIIYQMNYPVDLAIWRRPTDLKNLSVCDYGKGQNWLFEHRFVYMKAEDSQRIQWNLKTNGNEGDYAKQ